MESAMQNALQVLGYSIIKNHQKEVIYMHVYKEMMYCCAHQLEVGKV